jgi:hypothetical protein
MPNTFRPQRAASTPVRTLIPPGRHEVFILQPFVVVPNQELSPFIGLPSFFGLVLSTTYDRTSSISCEHRLVDQRELKDRVVGGDGVEASL